MLIVRVMAQVLIAAAIMVLGYDALNALESGTVDPLSAGELSILLTNQTGLAAGLEMETALAAAAGWPDVLARAYTYVLIAPAFLVLGAMGLLMALLFRRR